VDGSVFLLDDYGYAETRRSLRVRTQSFVPAPPPIRLPDQIGRLTLGIRLGVETEFQNYSERLGMCVAKGKKVKPLLDELTLTSG
jgi:hypothetical protein